MQVKKKQKNKQTKKKKKKKKKQVVLSTNTRNSDFSERQFQHTMPISYSSALARVH